MNEVITHEQYYEMLKDAELFTGINKNYESVTYYYGKRVVFTDKDIILFSRCSWCGSEDMKIDENNRCAHCGGWVTV